MITFHNELPLDHTKSLTYLAKKWSHDIYATNSNYNIERAWQSIGEHLWAENRKINVPVDKTYMCFADLLELSYG
jgi:hypothetical protein